MNSRHSARNMSFFDTFDQSAQEFNEILIKFTTTYLVENTKQDPIDFAATYFQNMRDNRLSTYWSHQSQKSFIQTSSLDAPSSFFDVNLKQSQMARRKPVFAEAFDPEEEDTSYVKIVFPKTPEQYKNLQKAVTDIFLFRSLDKEEMKEVLDAMFEKKVQPGEVVIRQGDDGDNFYVIEHGIFQALIAASPFEEPIVMHTYEDKGSFGELALLYNMPRAATIRAVTEGALWALDRHTFRRIVVRSTFNKRKMYEELIDSVPILKVLKPYERMNLADALVSMNFDDQAVIIKQDDEGDGMYFIEEGEVVVTVAELNDEIEVTRLKKGGYFGELAMVTNNPRAMTVKCNGPVKCAFLDKDAFERLLGPCIELMKRNIGDYEEQIRKIMSTKSDAVIA